MVDHVLSDTTGPPPLPVRGGVGHHQVQGSASAKRSRKLEADRADVLRVNDIIFEIDRRAALAAPPGGAGAPVPAAAAIDIRDLDLRALAQAAVSRSRRERSRAEQWQEEAVRPRASATELARLDAGRSRIEGARCSTWSASCRARRRQRDAEDPERAGAEHRGGGCCASRVRRDSGGAAAADEDGHADRETRARGPARRASAGAASPAAQAAAAGSMAASARVPGAPSASSAELRGHELKAPLARRPAEQAAARSTSCRTEASGARARAELGRALDSGEPRRDPARAAAQRLAERAASSRGGRIARRRRPSDGGRWARRARGRAAASAEAQAAAGAARRATHAAGAGQLRKPTEARPPSAPRTTLLEDSSADRRPRRRAREALAAPTCSRLDGVVGMLADLLAGAERHTSTRCEAAAPAEARRTSWCVDSARAERPSSCLRRRPRPGARPSWPSPSREFPGAPAPALAASGARPAWSGWAARPACAADEPRRALGAASCSAAPWS